jgi:hypothetical protein
MESADDPHQSKRTAALGCELPRWYGKHIAGTGEYLAEEDELINLKIVALANHLTMQQFFPF